MDAVQVAIEERVFEQHRHHSKGQFFWVWGALLVMTGMEVYLAYQNLEPIRMLGILMGPSIIKAARTTPFLLHRRFEIPPTRLITMASLVFCLGMMMVFLPDAFRILHLGVNLVAK